MHCWRTIIFFLLVLGAPFFFIGGPNYHSARSLCELWNLGHVIFFALLTIVLCTVLTFKGYSDWRKFLYSIGLGGMLGLFVEIIQLAIVGRLFSFADVGRDIIGVLIVICWIWARKSALWRRTGFYCGCFFLIAVSLSPFIIAITDEYQARQEFPVLAGFIHPFELSRWKHNEMMEFVSEVGGEPLSATKIDFGVEQYSGVSLVYFPRDWSGWSFVQFRVYSPGDPIVLHFRIHDNVHSQNQVYQDRYNGKTTLQRGWNTIRISLEEVQRASKFRELDLKNIYGFGLFVMNQKQKHQLYLDNVRLL